MYLLYKHMYLLELMVILYIVFTQLVLLQVKRIKKYINDKHT